MRRRNYLIALSFAAGALGTAETVVERNISVAQETFAAAAREPWASFLAEGTLYSRGIGPKQIRQLAETGFLLPTGLTSEEYPALLKKKLEEEKGFGGFLKFTAQADTRTRGIDPGGRARFYSNVFPFEMESWEHMQQFLPGGGRHASGISVVVVARAGKNNILKNPFSYSAPASEPTSASEKGTLITLREEPEYLAPPVSSKDFAEVIVYPGFDREFADLTPEKRAALKKNLNPSLDLTLDLASPSDRKTLTKQFNTLARRGGGSLWPAILTTTHPNYSGLVQLATDALASAVLADNDSAVAHVQAWLRSLRNKQGGETTVSRTENILQLVERILEKEGAIGPQSRRVLGLVLNLPKASLDRLAIPLWEALQRSKATGITKNEFTTEIENHLLTLDPGAVMKALREFPQQKAASPEATQAGVSRIQQAFAKKRPAPRVENPARLANQVLMELREGGTIPKEFWLKHASRRVAAAAYLMDTDKTGKEALVRELLAGDLNAYLTIETTEAAELKARAREILDRLPPEISLSRTAPPAAPASGSCGFFYRLLNLF